MRRLSVGRIVLVFALLVWNDSATARRVAIWQDNLSLWEDAVLKAPCSARAWLELSRAAAAYGMADRVAEAWDRLPDLLEGKGPCGAR